MSKDVKHGDIIVPAEEIEEILATERRFRRECRRRERQWQRDGFAVDCNGLCNLSSCCIRSIGPAIRLSREEVSDLARRVHAGEGAYGSLESGDFEPDEKERLERLAEMGLLARRHLAACNIALVVSLEKKFNRGDIDQMDVIQAGLAGLMRAIESYDYASGHAFSTYAAFWINNSFQDARRMGEWLFCIPRDVYVTWNKVMYAEYNYDAPHGELPTDEEIGKEIGMPERLVTTARKAVCDAVPLDQPVFEYDGVQQARRTIGDLLPDISPGVSPEAWAEDSDLTEGINRILRKLDRDEYRFLVVHRYGIGGAPIMPVQELAAHLGLRSTSTVYDRMRRILKTLRGEVHASYQDYLYD